MKKKFNIISMFIICILLTGCCFSHDWQEATCTEPKTCSKCGEIEGEALEHSWVEVTCSAPKTCSICGESEGQALEHILTEANYQQASVCQVCGEEVGETLQANYENWGIDVYAAELDKVYDIEIECYQSTKATTIAKVAFSNYRIIKSDENHPAKEGYEWRIVDMNAVVGDDNAYDYGYKFSNARWYDNYYKWIDNDKENRFTINYYGVEYNDCEYYIDVANSGWENKEQFGWKSTLTLTDTISILVPEGFDGFVYGLYNPKSNFWDADLKDVAPENYIYFRFR